MLARLQRRVARGLRSIYRAAFDVFGEQFSEVAEFRLNFKYSLLLVVQSGRNHTVLGPLPVYCRRASLAGSLVDWLA